MGNLNAQWDGRILRLVRFCRSLPVQFDTLDKRAACGWLVNNYRAGRQAMQMHRKVLFVFIASIMAFALHAGVQPNVALAQSGAALTGQVSSEAEGAMEGVVVSARREGASYTVSVVSDDQGHYQFPVDRLEPGEYALSIRAVGYELDGADATIVAAGTTASADLTLIPTRNLSAQLTNAEWLLSIPGTHRQKAFMLNCTSCHTLERVMKSSYDAEGFLDVFDRMAKYYPGSMPTKPQRLNGTAMRMGRTRAAAGEVADWLSSINLSQSETRQYELQTLPRLTGASTKVIITEYDLPNDLIQPHDVIIDGEGDLWYSDFGQMFLGKMDTTTGEVTQYPIPVAKPGWPTGTLDLEADRDGNIWIGVMYQANIARFDPKTEQFQQWNVPAEWQTDGSQTGHLAVRATHVDGKVWMKNSDETNIYRMDIATGEFEDFGTQYDPETGRKLGVYGLHSDSNNNVYLLDFSSNNIGKIDADTGELSVYKTPSLGSRPRRGRVDAQDRLWFAEYGTNAIGVFDPDTESFAEWSVPTPWSAPYDAIYDNAHNEAWTGSMFTDRVSRLDVETGQYIEYPLPRSTNIRRVFVDERTNPGTLWIGSNHGASIVKVEPLE
jgi:streptogramin lyase